MCLGYFVKDVCVAQFQAALNICCVLKGSLKTERKHDETLGET